MLQLNKNIDVNAWLRHFHENGGMMISELFSKSTAIVVTSAIVAGCAAPGAPVAQNGTGDPCNPLAAALLGGMVGYAAEGSGKGAAAGAGIAAAACLAINYSSQQDKTSKQIQADYEKKYRKLPEKTTVLSYTSRLSAHAIKPGSSTVLSTAAEVVTGKNDQEPRIDEEMVINTPDNKEFKKLRKPAGTTGGAYTSRFNIDFPKGMDEGVYHLTTSLFINDKKVKSLKTKLQVVLLKSGERSLLVLNR